MSAAPRSPWEACVNNAGSPDSTDITRWNYDASCNTLQVGNELVNDMVADCSNYSNEKSSCIFQTGLNLQGQGTAPVTNIQWNQERRDNLTSSGTSSIQQAPNFLPNGSPVLPLPQPCSWRAQESRSESCLVFDKKRRYDCLPDSTTDNCSALNVDPWTSQTQSQCGRVGALMDPKSPLMEATRPESTFNLLKSIDFGIATSVCQKKIRVRKAKTEVEVKDERYWERRNKNTLAAKRSRDAKREKELKAEQRIQSLEIENTRLRLELSCLREENEDLKRCFNFFYP